MVGTLDEFCTFLNNSFKENLTLFSYLHGFLEIFGMRQNMVALRYPCYSEILRHVFIKIMVKILQVGYPTLKSI